MMRFTSAAGLILLLLFVPTVDALAEPAQACNSERMLLFASLADNLVNVAAKTADNEKKAITYSARAVAMEKSCMDASTSSMEHGRIYLLMAHDMMLAAVAADELGNNKQAQVFAGFSLKIWKEIASVKEYPAGIRKSAQKEIDASK